jgi:hypothetical protein
MYSSTGKVTDYSLNGMVRVRFQGGRARNLFLHHAQNISEAHQSPYNQWEIFPKKVKQPDSKTTSHIYLESAIINGASLPCSLICSWYGVNVQRQLTNS